MSKKLVKSRSVPARAENLHTNERLVSTCCEFFLTLSLKNSVFILFKFEICPCLTLKKLHQWSKYPENSCYHTIKNWNFFIICKSHFCAVLQSFCKILFDFRCCRAVIKNCTTFKVMKKASVIQIY